MASSPVSKMTTKVRAPWASVSISFDFIAAFRGCESNHWQWALVPSSAERPRLDREPWWSGMLIFLAA